MFITRLPLTINLRPRYNTTIIHLKRVLLLAIRPIHIQSPWVTLHPTGDITLRIMDTDTDTTHPMANIRPMDHIIPIPTIRLTARPIADQCMDNRLIKGCTRPTNLLHTRNISNMSITPSHRP